MRYFICGIHTSGKTTILSRLKEEGIIDYNGSEIGKDLYYQRRNEGFSTSAQEGVFEQEITTLELERDISVLPLFRRACIESWHPGNLAYALVRNPSEEESLVKRMSSSPLMDAIVGIWLRQDPKNIAVRTKTFASDAGWAVDFYTRINDALERSLLKLGLTERTVMIDAGRPLDDVYADVKAEIMNRSMN